MASLAPSSFDNPLVSFPAKERKKDSQNMPRSSTAWASWV